MQNRGLIVRVGDADDYHVESCLADLADRLREHGITEIMSDGIGRFIADEFRGNNYISLFLGDHDPLKGSALRRDLTNIEKDRINAMLALTDSPAHQKKD